MVPNLKKTFSRLHKEDIHSISLSSNCENFISSDYY